MASLGPTLELLSVAGNGDMSGSLPPSWSAFVKLGSLDVRGICRWGRVWDA